MTGLNLQTLLNLLRVDLGLWASFAAIVAILALMTWTSWGSRRALRKCLVVSVVIHLGLIVFGGQTALGLRVVGLNTLARFDDEPEPGSIREILVTPEPADGDPADPLGDESGLDLAAVDGSGGGGPGVSRPLAAWEQPTGPLLADNLLDIGQVPRPDRAVPVAMEPAPPDRPADPVAPEAATPEMPVAGPAAPEERSEPEALALADDPVPEEVGPAPADESIELPVVESAPSRTPAPDPVAALRDLAPGSLLPDRPTPSATAPRAPMARSDAGERPAPLNWSTPARSREIPALRPEAASVPEPRADSPGIAPDPLAMAAASETAPTASEPGEIPAAAAPPTPPRPAPSLAMPGRAGVLTPGPGPSRPASGMPSAPIPRAEDRAPLAIAHGLPSGSLARPGLANVPTGPRRLPDVPEVYRPRLDPNRTLRAQQSGASRASEEAVERALVWLAQHQDADGRWDAAVETDASGAPLAGADDFTVHCPPGEVCSGPCYYWEADTAMTGLALLAYLGAGYTHTEGMHARTIARGLSFLLSVQKPDGDLRDRSRAVGMYCHAMAALALCEAYALTGDPALRDPAERSVRFLVNSSAADGMSWRYLPGAPVGDTSILGWVILVLKSGEELGFEIPETTRDGAARWLRLVASGSEGGLAAYQPGHPATPTMTAEAWVCRRFLGVDRGGSEAAEAARYLLEHGPGIDPYDLYYWYYGTLAMFQHGGEPWTRWNEAVRDQLVRHQVQTGHQAGSWDPAHSKGKYDSLGGRVYSTAMATLTLEVYYRYLRLYNIDQNDTPPSRLAPRPDEPGDPTLRRAGAGATGADLGGRTVEPAPGR